MVSLSEIEKKKKLLRLPVKKDQLEYFGPVSREFADSFLTMGHTFLYQYFSHIKSNRLKAIFSSFVEMVQNVSEYNKVEFKDNYPQSFFRLKGDNGTIIIETANRIKEKDLFSVKTIFENVCKLSDEELQSEYKSKLLTNGSLGIIMLKKLPDSNFSYHLECDKNGTNWLGLELKINYGNT